MNKKSPKYSFVIPALNEEKLLSECIESVKRQKNTSFEIIVCDNGSADNTAKIALRLGCKVVKEKKRGISKARNRGASIAKGEYLCFIDADEVLSKKWLQVADKRTLKGKTLIDGLIVFTNKNKLKEYIYNFYTLIIYMVLTLSKYLARKHFVTGNNMVIKRSLFEKIGGFDPVVSEQISFSKKLWKLKVNSSIQFDMIVYASSRRFDREGYIRTILRWAKAAVIKTSDKNYYLKRILRK